MTGQNPIWQMRKAITGSIAAAGMFACVATAHPASAGDAKQEKQMAVIHLEARDIPVPTTISPEARAVLEAQIARWTPPAKTPALDDHDGWRNLIAERDGYLLKIFTSMLGPADHVVRKTMAGVTIYEATPSDAERTGEGTIIFLHGGGMVLGGGELVRYWAELSMKATGRHVVAVDFRNPPDHPYPAAIEDCQAVYLELLKSTPASQIVLVGNSGGGNLAVAMTLRLARGSHPLPAAIALESPAVEIAGEGDSFAVLDRVDTQLSKLDAYMRLYANGHSLTDPDLSPVYADFPANFPPTWIQSGTRDLLLSNAVMLHRALRQRGLEAELHVWEAMPHGGFNGQGPEEADKKAELRRFIKKHLPK